MSEPTQAGEHLADRMLYCKDCKQAFVFTVGEQRFYQEKSLLNEPKRCKDCRAAMRRTRNRLDRNPARDLYSDD